MNHWGVVGGGMLGMTLAHRLRRQGHEVTLLEAGSGLGGLASAWSIGDVVWDRHYHVILLSDIHLRGLLGELGLETELRWTLAKTGFYADGEMHSMSNALEFLNFPLLNLFQKMRLAATILYASRIRDWQPLEQVKVEDWLRRWSGDGTFEKIWLPLLRAKLGERYERTSAAFIWATIARMYAARRTGARQEKFGYVQGGYARVLDRFTEFLQAEGVKIELDAATREVRPTEGGVRIAYAGDRSAVFDRVVLTVPAPVAHTLCPDLSAEEATRLRGVEHVGIVCASVLCEKPLTDYYITNITDSRMPFTAAIEMSAIVDREQLKGHSLIYLPKYASPGDAVFAQSDEELRDSFLGALERMHPSFSNDQVRAFRVSRAAHVFALPTLGYSESLPSVKTSIPGLYIVNSAQIVNGTLNVNETVQLADRTLPILTGSTLGAGSDRG